MSKFFKRIETNKKRKKKHKRNKRIKKLLINRRKIRFKVITLFAITLQKIAKNNFAKLGHTQYE